MNEIYITIYSNEPKSDFVNLAQKLSPVYDYQVFPVYPRPMFIFRSHKFLGTIT